MVEAAHPVGHFKAILQRLLADLRKVRLSFTTTPALRMLVLQLEKNDVSPEVDLMREDNRHDLAYQ